MRATGSCQNPGSIASHAELTRLAQLAQRFTPRVSLEPPDALLLEVRGSLHLFSGLAGLKRALVQMCEALALRPLLGFAPTPLAALVAARAGRGRDCDLQPVALRRRARHPGAP